MKEGLVRVLLSGGGEANKKTFLKDLNKESRGKKKVGAAFRLAMALMEDGKLWLQVNAVPVMVSITCARPILVFNQKVNKTRAGSTPGTQNR